MEMKLSDIEKKRIRYLEENAIVCDCDYTEGWCLEMYTPAGGDMVWYLDDLTPECLQEYIDNFDINENVLSWWQDGGRGSGVPFANVRDHYNDVEEWLNELQRICDDMPIEC